ncbi:hypothetical protein [Curtobacterium sp. MCBD17_003]|uniref:hypothetical protein n=1 Tax=Curtobacterium sp. MCBD17_003 TaxID=2175667 RepID=UPI0011B76D18|nr:hypothetical protein [Curtobacterium sp. MCBD17_003]WIE53436.1 hypothetical protein DEI88_009710 [Curtobacterium sp. MCBD17_003]
MTYTDNPVSRANDRMQQIKRDADAAAQAELDAIIDRPDGGSELVALRAASRAASDEAEAARRAYYAMAESDGRTVRRDADGSFRRRRDVSVEDFDNAYRDWQAAEGRAVQAYRPVRLLEDSLSDAPIANLAGKRAGAESALMDHLAALPEALTGVIEHISAIRTLAPFAGLPLAGVNPAGLDAAAMQLLPDIERTVDLAQRRRAAAAADAGAAAGQLTQIARDVQRLSDARSAGTAGVATAPDGRSLAGLTFDLSGKDAK